MSVERRIDTETYPDGEFQNYEIVSGFSWDDISFVSGHCTAEAVGALARLYETFIIPKAPDSYGTLCFCHVPEDIDLPSMFLSRTVDGVFYDRQALVAYHVSNLISSGGVFVRDGSLVSSDLSIGAFLSRLSSGGWLVLVEGEADSLQFLPVSSRMDFPSRIEASHHSVTGIPSVVCNAHFFLMEVSDRESPYDILGTPYGLAVKDGVVTQPPLNHREALLVDQRGRAMIGYPELTELCIVIDGKEYRHGLNCTFYSRPECRTTPSCEGAAILVVNDRVVALKPGGSALVPMAGFIIQTDDSIDISDMSVQYHGLEAFMFGVQVGPAMVDDGTMIDYFRCPFYQGDGVAYPPTVFSLPYESVPAARMSVGERDGMPLLIWAEGASKLGYRKGEESSGSVLPRFARYCTEIGVQNLVNLDGGGSAQIVFDGRRFLKISDRRPGTNRESERPVPICLLISK